MTTSASNPVEPLLHVNADVPTLLKVFSSLSSQPKAFINWTPEWAPQKNKWLKRPTQNISNPFLHRTLSQAATTSPILGLVCNDLHPVIAIDIDGASLSTPSLNQLLTQYPTYVEESPSGKPNHLRLLYQLPSLDDKALLRRKGTVVPKDQPDGATSAIELYNASSNFVTLTGKSLPGYPLLISAIPATIIADLFPEFGVTPVIDIKTRTKIQPQQNALLTPAVVWIREVPCLESDPALIAFMGKHSLIYHDYWLLGLMAIHAAFGSIQGYQIADEWSKSSGDAYDPAELASRWESISDPTYEPPSSTLPSSHASITAGTYQWMFNEFSIQWPVLNAKTKIPKPAELENFQAFLAYKGLTPEIDVMTGVIFLDGAPYSLYPTYYESKEASYAVHAGDLERLAVLLVLEAQPYKFRPTASQVFSWLKDLAIAKKKTINRFAREVATAPAYNPDTEPDYIRLMGTEIIQRNPDCEDPNQEFHNLLVRKWLLSLGRNLWPELTQKNPTALTATSEGVLILSSPLGGINKSSFGVRLFPKEWQHLHVSTKPRLSGQFADKDSLQKTIGKLVVDFDEAERIFSSNDVADLKAYLTERYDMFRPPYGRDVQQHTRFFSCMASTNIETLTLPREGARRYWWLNVSYVDTYAMDKMDMYGLWRQILHELKLHTGKRAPYILTSAESKYLESYLVKHTTTNGAEELLNDVYDFSEEGFQSYTRLGRLSNINANSVSITEICNTVMSHASGRIPGPKVIKHAVIALLKRHAPDIRTSRASIKHGYARIHNQDRYFMPDLRNDALKRAADEDLQ